MAEMSLVWPTTGVTVRINCLLPIVGRCILESDYDAESFISLAATLMNDLL